jgi:RimJ/RimL family protein N-acetyltransferase
MTELPTFRTARLTLRQRSLLDTDACMAMDCDPEVHRFLSLPWSDPLRHRAFVEARTRGPYPAGQGYWTILFQDAFVGWILLLPLDTIGPEIEIGWRLRRDAWSQGFATEAAAPILAHGLRSLRLTQVIADIAPENVGSRRVAEKLDMRPGEVVHTPHGMAIRYTATPAPQPR